MEPIERIDASAADPSLYQRGAAEETRRKALMRQLAERRVRRRARRARPEAPPAEPVPAGQHEWLA